MKKENELSVVVDQSAGKLWRPKYREVSSRFMSPSSPSNSLDIGNPAPIQALSPVRRKPDWRKNRPAQLDDSASLRGLWPSSTTSSSSSSVAKVDTLADHLGNDRLNDLLERKSSVFLDRQRSSREFVNRFENDKNVTSTKENHRPLIGGSMRYTGNPRFSGKSPSLSSASKVFNSSEITPGRLSVDENGRLSVDENALFQKSSRRMSDGFTGNMESGSEFCDAGSGTFSRGRKSGVEVSSKYMNDIGARHKRGTSESNMSNSDSSPRLGKFTIQKAIKRANSLTGYGSSKSQWALSPGRSDSPLLSVENKGKLMSFSSLRPPNSPSRTKGVEKLLNFGLDLFKTKKASNSSPSPSSSCNSLPGGHGATESAHQLRMIHNRLMQWRFANAKADSANANLAIHVESNLKCGSNSLAKLRHSVVQKKLQLAKEKFEMKMNFVLQSQLKLLEDWADMERQHWTAVSMTKESLHSVISKVPLIEGAKVDIHSALIAFQHALDLISSIKLMLTTFSPANQETASLISELAEVVAQEKLLLDECHELFKNISNLEAEEMTLRCSIMQMESFQKQKSKSRKEDKKSIHAL